MPECELISKCPIFEKSRLGIIEGVFGSIYCKGTEMENCARRKLKLAGQEVPPTLLPNGKHLDSLAE